MTVAVWLEVTVPALALNDAVVEPRPTVTEAGTDKADELLDKLTAAPDDGAARVNVTVQELEAPEVRVVGLHCSEDTLTTGLRLSDADREAPLYEAVTVAVWADVTEEAVAVKDAPVDPAGTVTEAGTERLELLSERATTAPPEGAAPVSETEQVVEPGVAIVVGLQLKALRPLTICGPVTVPPLPLSAIDTPWVETPYAFETAIDELATPEAIVTLTVATVPFAIELAFSPVARQV